MNPFGDQSILAEVGIAPARRFALLVGLFVLGGMLAILGVTSDAQFIGRAILLVVGILLLYQAEVVRRTPIVTLQLTQEGLFQSDGVLLAAAEQFRSIDRGALAVKPTHGFTINLHEKQPRAWVPGLWWRIGRRVGVGGVTSAGAAKFMAEQIALMIASKK